MSAAPAPWPPPEVSGKGRPTDEGTWRSPGYRSSWLRARVAITLLAAAVAADAAGTLLDLQGLSLMGAADAGTLTEAEAIAFDDLNSKVALIQLALYVASAVGVLAWLSRVVENVPPLTGAVPRRGPRAAIGWWFVPFANLVVPYQIVADAVRRLRTNDTDPTERLLVPWWGLWLVASVLGNVLWRLPNDTIDDLRVRFTITAVSDGANVAAGILLILIVRGVERSSHTRARTVGLGRSAQPAWPQDVAVSLPDPMAGVPSAAFATEIVDGVAGDAAAEVATPPVAAEPDEE
jgi:hypothetical protein